jgi:hypothetical protein
MQQDARYINDDLLVSLAPHLNHLRTFKLTGCGHAGPRGIFAVLRSAMDTLEDLALEGVNLVRRLCEGCWNDEKDSLVSLLTSARQRRVSSGCTALFRTGICANARNQTQSSSFHNGADRSSTSTYSTRLQSSESQNSWVDSVRNTPGRSTSSGTSRMVRLLTVPTPRHGLIPAPNHGVSTYIGPY